MVLLLLGTQKWYPNCNSTVNHEQSTIQPWKDAVPNCLQVYRATLHATKSTSPYKLLYGRKMHTKLDILPLPPTASSVDASAHHTVLKHQEKMKHYAGAKRCARKPFHPGEKVRIKKQFHVPKAQLRSTRLVTVTKKVGPNSLLSDGKIWNTSSLAHGPSVEGQDSSVDFQTLLSIKLHPTDPASLHYLHNNCFFVWWITCLFDWPLYHNVWRGKHLIMTI